MEMKSHPMLLKTHSLSIAKFVTIRFLPPHIRPELDLGFFSDYCFGRVALQRRRSQIETGFLVSVVSSNFFGKSTEIYKKFLADSEYYLLVNHVIVVDRDVSEADGLLHGVAGSWRDCTKCLKR